MLSRARVRKLQKGGDFISKGIFPLDDIFSDFPHCTTYCLLLYLSLFWARTSSKLQYYGSYPVERWHRLKGWTFCSLGLLFTDDVACQGFAEHLAEQDVAAFLELLDDRVVQRVLVLLQPASHVVRNGSWNCQKLLLYDVHWFYPQKNIMKQI